MVCQSMVQWFAIHDSPQEGIQTPVFLLNAQSRAGVSDGGSGSVGLRFATYSSGCRICCVLLGACAYLIALPAFFSVLKPLPSSTLGGERPATA